MIGLISMPFRWCRIVAISAHWSTSLKKKIKSRSVCDEALCHCPAFSGELLYLVAINKIGAAQVLRVHLAVPAKTTHVAHGAAIEACSLLACDHRAPVFCDRCVHVRSVPHSAQGSSGGQIKSRSNQIKMGFAGKPNQIKIKSRWVWIKLRSNQVRIKSNRI